MKFHITTLFVLFGTVLSTSFSFANQTSVTNTISQAQSTQQSVEKSLNIQHSQSSENKWTEWGLTQTEWLRYEELKKGARGIWSPNLDPLTMLGVEACSDNERKHYAELLAKKEYQRVEKEFAFQIAYNQVFERLYPNQLPFRMDDSGQPTSAINRVIYFTRTDCEPCIDNLKRLQEYIQNYPLDIYVVDSMQNDETIRNWALKNNIDIAKVRARQITLNHDSGYWLKYAKGKMPAAFKIKGDGEWQSLVY